MQLQLSVISDSLKVRLQLTTCTTGYEYNTEKAIKWNARASTALRGQNAVPKHFVKVELRKESDFFTSILPYKNCHAIKM